MNTDLSSIILLTFYSFLSLVHSQSTNQALIFNPQTHEVYPNWESSAKHEGPYAVACPISYAHEVQFNTEYSFNYKATIVRYADKKTTNAMARKKCTRKYKLSIAVHFPSSTEQLVKFGYEVFFDRTKFNVKFGESNYKKFHPILKFNTMSDRFENIRKREAGPVMKKDEKQPDLVDMGFVWLTKIAMRYDFSTMSLQSLTYYVDKTVDKSKIDLKCDNVSLGLEMYDLDVVGRYYAPHGQAGILRRMKLPELNEKGVCNTTYYNCFDKYYLLPIYQFQTTAWAEISCSEMATIPIWYETTEDALNYLEKFFVAVAQVADNRLKITPGVHDILAFPSITDENELIPIYLYDAKQKYPAPKIIFKIVSYQSHECRREDDLCWFDMVIVIHNQPKVNENDKLCDDNCSKLGWESIQFLSTTDRNEEKKSKNIYCCELNAEMRKLLLQSEDDFKREDFNLKQFPYYDEVNTKNEFRDMQEAIEQKMEELFKIEDSKE